MLSFWEKESFLQYDTIIVGSGIVGLCTAIAIREKFPQNSVLVLERGIFPTGASTRNAGFACFGSLTEILSDLHINGWDKTRYVIENRIRGLQWLRSRLGDAAMDYQPVGGYELIFEKDLPAVDEIDTINSLLKDIFSEPVYSLRKDLIQSFGFNQQTFHTMVYNPYEGHIHTGKLMQALLRLAQEKGVDIHTGTEVTHIEENAIGISIYVQEKPQGRFAFQANYGILCTNAFTSSLLPDLNIQPGRGQVLITKPISSLPWQGTFHFEEGYYYFRNVGKRVLFGGGRNLAFEQETTTQFESNPHIFAALQHILQHDILPGQTFEIEQTWSGIMGFSADKFPVIKKVSPHLSVGFACNGMGVSLAGAVAEELTQQMT
ncbi:FAD-binding oxidoreductase [Rhodocytophaga rosea]|uniref:FAD-binding oxidoreductase n=1 Tax=Rhodocytophaga rosea TaxID=2704465 RepID=A0A6C0GNU9_9BACT|nr:FAD-dependent oxidoreductase [Rhodocytophaga rosea]QHT69300.1 FAD-binding oxidoreductase [Rhodocytophaga rosea]